ncbi:MAG: hypothetical protein AB1705_11860 [Verrucomicrobiota bacterium]
MLEAPPQGLMFMILMVMGFILGALYWGIARGAAYVFRIQSPTYWRSAKVLLSACFLTAVIITICFPLGYEIRGAGSTRTRISLHVFEWYLWTGKERDLRLKYDGDTGALHVRAQEFGSRGYQNVPAHVIEGLGHSVAPIVFYERRIKGRYGEVEATWSE